MQKLSMLTALAVLLTAAAPAVALAQSPRAKGNAKAVRTYDRNRVSPPYASSPGFNAYARGGPGLNAYGRGTNAFGNPYDPAIGRYQYRPGQNLPYPDRPYGDPDRW
jgi:hypothetical protein